MKFGEKLRKQRKKQAVSLESLSEVIGVTRWTISNYERGLSHPKDRSVYFKLADFFDVDVNYFLTEDEEFLTEAADKYGKRGRAQAESLVEQTSAMFAGGELSDEDQIAFLTEIQELYLDSKRRAKEKNGQSK